MAYIDKYQSFKYNSMEISYFHAIVLSINLLFLKYDLLELDLHQIGTFFQILYLN